MHLISAEMANSNETPALLVKVAQIPTKGERLIMPGGVSYYVQDVHHRANPPTGDFVAIVRLID